MSSFKFAGMELEYLKHSYNRTSENMRTIEVPIINELLRIGSRWVLEIGNVLSHYQKTSWHILDKFEKASGIMHEDLMIFEPLMLYDLIVSISTIEHIGFGKYAKDSIIWHPFFIIKKIRSLLATGGMAFITVPIRYNPLIDNYLLEGHIGSNIMGCMHRISNDNEWEECSLTQAYETDKRRPQGYKWSTGMVLLRVNNDS